jgi:hypothetical protein
MIYPRPDYRPTPYDDDWEDIPKSGPVPKWLGGVIVPLALIGYGVTCFFTKHAVLSGRFDSMELHGANATALAVTILSLGIFLHCHYFWGNIIHLSPWAVLGKIVSMTAMIGSLGFVIVHVGVLGH